MRLLLSQPVLFVLQQLEQARYDAFLVGGAVRDILLGRPTTDWDITTNASPEQIMKVFAHHFYTNTFGTVGLPFTGLVTDMKAAGWIVDETLANDPAWADQILDVTTYRIEFGYSDKRRPDSVSWGKTIEEDLSRRDFTINALAIRLDQKQVGDELSKQRMSEVEVTIEDPFDGQGDLAKQLIRAVGDPKQRFSEDALRMMRAIRFGAQLGFVIEPETLEAIQNSAALISHVSWERIRDELLKILASPFPADGMLLLHNAGLLEYVLPELLPMQGIKQGGHHIYDVWTHSLEALRGCPSSDPIVRLATLLHDVAKPKTVRYQGPRGVTFYGHEVVGARMAKKIGERLRLSTSQIEKLVILVRWHMFVYNKEMTDGAIRRFIKRVGLENINDIMLLRVGDRKGGGSRATSWRLNELQQRIGEQLYEPLSLKDLAIDGSDVMKELNITPGKKVGEILHTLFEEVLDESKLNNREYLLKRIKELA
jgi:putative nucleotidyltransferase with HDIG domain